MSKWLIVIPVALVTMCALSETERVGDYTWTYRITGDTAVICSAPWTCAISPNPTGALRIPAELGGKLVTCIGNQAFYYCGGLSAVTIPSNITCVCDLAFEGCSGLTSVNFEGAPPDGLLVSCLPADIVLNYNVEFEDEWLSMITTCGFTKAAPYTLPLPDGGPYQEEVEGLTWTFTINRKGVTIGNGNSPATRFAFEEITIPSVLGGKPVKNIGNWAFYNCTGLTSVTIPGGVTNIGDWAFLGCSRLATVKMPLSLKTISMQAFESCRDLASVTIPTGVTSIGILAFSGTGLTSVVIPPSVTSIGDLAFRDCSKLSSVEIPSSVMNLGHSVFSGCTGLTSVVIPKNMTEISTWAFFQCSGLKSLTMPSSVTNIGAVAFAGCSSLTSLAIPSRVRSIGESAFASCSNLMSLSIPSSVRSIGESAFRGCSSLKSVVIPSRVTSVGDYAFYDCSGLTSVTIQQNVRSIGSGAFGECGLLKTVYVCKGDVDRIQHIYSWPNNVDFIETNVPFVDGDSSALVMGDAENGFVIMPSAGNSTVDVVIPQCVDAARVTVELSPEVESVTPRGAKVKIARGGSDITEFLDIPATDENGAIDLTNASIKKVIVKEVMNVKQGAVIELKASNPLLITSYTRKGLVYKLREGVTLEGMRDGDRTVGDGQPWAPVITVRGGISGFYSIEVSK